MQRAFPIELLRAVEAVGPPETTSGVPLGLIGPLPVTSVPEVDDGPTGTLVGWVTIVAPVIAIGVEVIGAGVCAGGWTIVGPGMLTMTDPLVFVSVHI